MAGARPMMPDGYALTPDQREAIVDVAVVAAAALQFLRASGCVATLKDAVPGFRAVGTGPTLVDALDRAFDRFRAVGCPAVLADDATEEEE